MNMINPPGETRNHQIDKRSASAAEAEIGADFLWQTLSTTPGIGVSITDAEGRLIFVNDMSQVLFSEKSGLDYLGKRISDYHPPEFVKERLAMIRRVLDENQPLSIEHIYHGRRIESTVWPIRDSLPPHDRVIVITRTFSAQSPPGGLQAPEMLPSEFIDLGPLSVLTKRELEVLVLLGHGMSVPSAAEMLHRSPKTIERHKTAIGQKLNISGQAEMVAIVSKVGLELGDAELKRYRR